MGKNNSLPPQSRRSEKAKRFSLKPLILSVLIVVSSISAIPLFNSQQVGAVNTVGDQLDSNFDWRVKSLLYYRALARCFKLSGLPKSDTTKMSLADAKDGKWFIGTGVNLLQTSASPTVLGVYMRDATSGDTMDVGTDGIVSCDNNTFIKSALNLWGISPVEMLCNSGFRRVDIGVSQTVAECQTGSIGADFERRDGGKDNNVARFMTYIKTVVYGDENKEPSLSKAEWYYYYRHSLEKSCIANIATKAPGKNAVGGDNQYGYNDVKWVNESTKTVEIGSYIGTWKNNETVTLRTTADPNIAPTTPAIYRLSCSETVVEMNDNAQAYRDWLVTNSVPPAIPSNDPTQPENGATTCAIDGIGWMVCPIVTTLGDVTDGMFTFIADHFLKTDITFLQTDGGNTGTFLAWSLMRNIANIAFVIVFLIIIFSQLTGVGVANYGVKKLLPRLVIGAILVNLSFFVCQLAVDLSNVLGFGLKSLFDGITSSVQAGASIPTTDVNGTEGVSIWKSIVSTVLVAGAATAALAAGLGSLVSVLIVALVAVATIFFILILRQVLIILLIVIAPLAFVAFLLPNTEKFFTQWRKLFTTLLLLFPIIGLVFGASTLASNILKTAYSGTGTDGTIGQVIAAGALMIPLFVVPFILKGALDGFGQLGSTINKLGSGIGKGVGGRAKTAADKGAKTLYDNSALGRGRAIRRQARQNYRDTKFAESIKDGKGLRAAFARGPNITKSQQAANKALARSANTVADKAFMDDINAAESLLRNKYSNPSTQLDEAQKAFKTAVMADDSVGARAAQNIMLGGGTRGLDLLHQAVGSNGVREILENKTDDAKDVSKSVRNGLNAAGLKGKNNVLNEFAFNKLSFNQTQSDPVTLGKLNDVELGGQSFNVLKKGESSITPAQASAVLNNQNVFKDLDQAKKDLFAKIAGIVLPSSSPTVPPSDGTGSASTSSSSPIKPAGGSGSQGLIVPGDDNYTPPPDLTIPR